MAATATAPRTTRQNKTASRKKDDTTREVLTNPFKAGERITIPSGTVFTSTAPTAKGRQVVKRAHKVTVMDSIPARVQPRNSEKGSKVLVRPVRVRAKGSGGYWKDITLTEKIVRLNGKPLSYETITIKPEPSQPSEQATELSEANELETSAETE